MPRIESDLPRLYDENEEASTTDQTGILVPKGVRSAPRPTLMVITSSYAGQVFRVTSERVTIGRSKEADITIAEQGVSRLHCVIAKDRSGNHFVEDPGSTNGTLVNGGPVERVVLNDGDRIQLGPEVVLQFGYIDDAEEGLANQLYEAATRDPLTGAYNRRHFFERLAAEVSYATRQRERLCALMLDIDHFKVINDSFGHAVGDSVLRELARTVRGTLRNEDVFARYGGEEFLILGRGLTLKNGIKFAERIRKLVEDEVLPLERHRFRVTISIGVAELGECVKSATGDELLRLADARLYIAKQRGRNRVVAAR